MYFLKYSARTAEQLKSLELIITAEKRWSVWSITVCVSIHLILYNPILL